jgi:ATP-dependent Clp protease protease subunit
MDPIHLDGVPDEDRRRRQYFARSTGVRFDLRAEADKPAEIDLYDEIGFWGVTAKDFRAKLKEVENRDITLKINSPGGDVFDGIAMFNDLIAHNGRIRVEITGLAASAASIVAMAGDEIVMGENAFMMIHNAWSIVIGNRHDLRDFAGTLDKIDGALAKTYATRTGLGIRTVSQMMDDETWLTAAEAKEKGFADSVGAKAEAKAAFDLSVYAKTPDALKAPDDGFSAQTIRDAERMIMRDAGYSRSQVRTMFSLVRKNTELDATRDAGDLDSASIASAFLALAERVKPKQRS